ncbi:hypothetical protein BU16DRAFT_570306 [Lophium mytilinum]|uniref:Zn(2)-C6 fungal-type domain-containing protein n=1 Tax=Lophium mytilinum TaxID=390894 RepID=A0A6A6R7R1_9PEZI|nr:hypothetical protein BU16DRAFT_570306 [Lophium mytilinum]
MPDSLLSPTHTGLSSPSPGPDRRSGLPPRIRRRNRVISSCLECRRRKLKCDKLQPCTNCTKFARDCVFLAPALDPVGQAKLAEVKEKMGLLERTLEQDVAKSKSEARDESSPSSQLPGQDVVDSEEDSAPEDEKDLKPNYYITEDAAYDDADDDLVDLGIQLGKMRITDRIGGYVRPRFAEEIVQALKEVPPPQPGNRYPTRTPTSFLGPGPDYVAPASSFFFAPEPRRMSLMSFLPARSTADRLLTQYWNAVHVLAKCLHRPSFERQYATFWSDIARGVEPTASFQAVVLAMLMSAAISLPDEAVLNEYAVAKADLVENFRQGCETSLSRANFLRTSKLETLQAFVMYLIPLCRGEISRAHSALTGTIIRLAECMSLHRDPSNYDVSAVEMQVRRTLWYQVCFLDMRTCEATGPRPQIRREDFDTKWPLNADDADLELPNPPTEDANRFTDMTITRIRFESNEMNRLIWIERPRIERKKSTITLLLSKIQSFGKAMETKYLPILDSRVPLQYMAMQIYGILFNRMHVQILSKYASNQDRLMPERLRQIMMGSSIVIIEHAMAIETIPHVRLWAWYAGAFQQYHSAILLLSEYYAKPRDDFALDARVWRALDFAFELPADLDGGEKSRMILHELHNRLETYQSHRRIRPPKSMAEAPGPRIHAHEFKRQEARRSKERGESLTPALDFNGPGGILPSTEPLDYSFTYPRMPDGVMREPTYSLPGMMSPMHGSDSSPSMSNAANRNVGGSGSNNNNSPGNPDNMLDIDWNEWERLFPSDMNAGGNSGDIMIPPFSFPHFSPSELEEGWAAGMGKDPLVEWAGIGEQGESQG